MAEPGVTRAMTRGRWAEVGAVAMAVIAVVALALTVLLAQRALGEASDVVVRGEGDLLMSTVATELVEGGPPTEAALAKALEAHREEGLRYLALVGRDHRPTMEAGTPSMTDAEIHPGVTTRRGQRVRISGPLFPRRPPASLPRDPSMPRGVHGGPPMPALVVIELEPPVIAKLRGDLVRIAVVGGAAGAVLLAFAIAWSRTASRLATIEAKASREQRLVALGGMSSVMAHELRNPLASLKGHAQLLAEDLEGDGNAKRKAKADRVVAEAERIEALTTSLLDFVRDGPIERAPVAISELVAGATADLPSAARVAVDVKEAPARVAGDAARLVRALHNLLDNAAQASPEASPVELRVAQDGASVVFAVRDHGEGLAAGTEASIFEPFVTTRTKGTGLGLAVVRRIAEQHGGTVTASNHAGGGAVFTLRLPAYEP